MKRIVLICFITVSVTNNLNADNWLTSFDEAKKVALATNKLILVDFWATWCGPCKRMESESWSKDDVKLLMNNFVSLKINIDANKGLASEYGVKAIPYIFIMDGNGKVVYKQISYKSKSEVISLLKKYALNTGFLSQDLINYYKVSGFANSFRLGKRYQDYCLYLNENLKADFLNLAEQYLKESSKLLKKSELKNKEVFEQKLKLLEIQEKLILKKAEKAIKMLDKIKETSVAKVNRPFYCFLNYIANKQLNNDDDANLWLGKVSESDKEKAELFLKSS